ncbi:MAG: CAP domain-containing protein [Ilumatobacteraceae bacterium]
MKALRSNHARRGALARCCLGVSILLGVVVTGSAVSQVSAAPPTYTGLVPARLLDTRGGSVTIDGQFAGDGQIGPSSVLNLTVLGRGGVPSSGVGAVAINLTAALATSNSYLTVYPTGSTRPTASNLNFAAAQTIANMVIVPVGVYGQISIYNNAAPTHLIVDVLGWFAVDAGYTGFTPARLLDTRSGGVTIDNQFDGGGQVGASSVLNLAVLGRGGVPSSGVDAVAINVTAASSTTGSFLTVYPSGAVRPTSSNLNFSAGQTIANMVIVPVGVDGRINLYNNAGQTHLIVDVLGWFADDADFSGSVSARLLDSRTGGITIDGQFDGIGPAGPASVLNLTVLGRGGVPSTGVGSVAINVTATQSCMASYVGVYPSGSPRPVASNLNFGVGQTIANMVIVPVGTDGKISLYNNAGETHLLVDVLGWFAGSPVAGATPVSSATSGCPPPPSPYSAVSVECTALTNAHRAAAGVAPVTISVSLNAAAQGHSQYQAAALTMTHTSANGSSPGTRITNAGYIWRAWGENVAFGQWDCAAVIAAWMNSPGHRTNMLNPVYTNIGIGMAIGSNGAKYWTMNLAAPR